MTHSYTGPQCGPNIAGRLSQGPALPAVCLLLPASPHPWDTRIEHLFTSMETQMAAKEAMLLPVGLETERNRMT